MRRRKVPSVVRTRPRIAYSDLMNLHASEIVKKYKTDARGLEQAVRFDYCDGASREDLQRVYENEIYTEKKRA